MLARFIILAGAWVLVACAGRNNIRVAGKPSKYTMVKEANGDCTVSTVVRVRVNRKPGDITLTSTKPTCEEAQADVQKGIESVRRKN